MEAAESAFCENYVKRTWAGCGDRRARRRSTRWSGTCLQGSARLPASELEAEVQPIKRSLRRVRSSRSGSTSKTLDAAESLRL